MTPPVTQQWQVQIDQYDTSIHKNPPMDGQCHEMQLVYSSTNTFSYISSSQCSRDPSASPWHIQYVDILYHLQDNL